MPNGDTPTGPALSGAIATSTHLGDSAPRSPRGHRARHGRTAHSMHSERDRRRRSARQSRCRRHPEHQHVRDRRVRSKRHQRRCTGEPRRDREARRHEQGLHRGHPARRDQAIPRRARRHSRRALGLRVPNPAIYRLAARSTTGKSTSRSATATQKTVVYYVKNEAACDASTRRLVLRRRPGRRNAHQDHRLPHHLQRISGRPERRFSRHRARLRHHRQVEILTQ